MGKWFFLVSCLMGLSSVTAWAADHTDAEGHACEETVDLAEQGQFHRLHFTCAEPDSADTDDDSALAVAPAAVSSGKSRQVAEVVSEPQADWTQIARIQAGLFQTMAQQCTAGWRKTGEWVSADAAGYRLHYTYQCL